jgi:hypothetical protein
MNPDIYFRLNPLCCDFPRLQLIHEVSMGYRPAVYCEKCNKMQGPDHVPRSEEE